MKLKIYAFLVCMYIMQSNANAQCNQTTESDSLDINNINALIMNGGDMWWNRSSMTAHYKVPKTGNASTLFSGGVWLGGYDAAGQLHMAAQTYRQTGNDFFSGPLDSLGNSSLSNCNNYDKIWKIYASDVSAHISNSPHTLTNTPTSVLEWPAIGNPYAKGANGVSLVINDNLAPFVDVNGDGIYNPLNGDYPDVCGDEALWYVMNDKGNNHTQTGCNPMGVEVQMMAYAFNSSDAALNNTTFYKYYITNKGNYVFDSTFFGVWIDPDLGCYTDDYFGSDSANQMIVIYNADANDAPCPTGYGTNIPMQGITLLNAKNYRTNSNFKMHGIYYYYNTTPISMGDPASCSQYYSAMTGQFHDSTHLTYGGNGHGGTVPTNYAYPTSPDITGTDPNTGLPSWSMCNPTSTPGDVRTILSIDIKKLVPKDIVELNFAAITHWGDTYPCPSFSGIENARNAVNIYFNSINCGKLGTTPAGLESIKDGNISFEIYPNPSTGNVVISNSKNVSCRINLFDVAGRIIASKNISDKSTLFDISGCSTGAYIYEIRDSKNKILQRGKLIKD